MSAQREFPVLGTPGRLELTKSPNASDEWSIAAAVDSAGLVYKKTSETYHGHGYPYPLGVSIQWKIAEYNGQYSKWVHVPSVRSSVDLAHSGSART